MFVLAASWNPLKGMGSLTESRDAVGVQVMRVRTVRFILMMINLAERYGAQSKNIYFCQARTTMECHNSHYFQAPSSTTVVSGQSSVGRWAGRFVQSGESGICWCYYMGSFVAFPVSFLGFILLRECRHLYPTHLKFLDSAKLSFLSDTINVFISNSFNVHINQT